MVLSNLLGDSVRIRILEELVSNRELFLTADEISRMADVSIKSVYEHLKELETTGILIINKKGSKKFKLNPKDKRTISLSILESDEFKRQLNNLELPLKENEEDVEVNIDKIPIPLITL